MRAVAVTVAMSQIGRGSAAGATLFKCGSSYEDPVVYY